MDSDKRISDLEKRVQQLEREIYSLKEKDQPALKHTTPLLKKEQLKEEKPEEKKQVDWERELGQTWLPRIFIFILLIGVIWAFRAGSDLGLINEQVRVVIGYLVGAALLFFGWRQFLKNHIVLSQVLLGGSIAFLFVTTFAAHVLYGFIPLAFAFTLHIVFTGLGLWVSIYFKSQSIGIISSIGGFLVPFLLASQDGNIYFFVTYEWIIFLAFIYVAFKWKYTILYYVTAYGFQLTLLVFVAIQALGDTQAVAIAVVAQHVVLVSLPLLREKWRNEHVFAALSTAALTAMWVTSSFYSQTIYTLVLGGLVALYLAVIYLKKDLNVRALFVSASAIVFLIYFMEIFDRSLGLLLLAEGFIVILLAASLRSRLQAVIGGGIYLIGCLITLLTSIEALFSIEMAMWTVFIATLVIQYVLYKDSKYVQSQFITFTKVMISLLGFIYISHLANLIPTDVTLQPMVLSIAWLVYAVFFVGYGFYKNDKVTRMFGIAVIFFTLAKVILVDIPAVSMAVRALLFLLLGSLGIVISRLFYRKEKVKT